MRWDANAEHKKMADDRRKRFGFVIESDGARQMTIGKHEARNWASLKEVYEQARDKCPRAADTIAWLLWWDICDADRLDLLTKDKVDGWELLAKIASVSEAVGIQAGVGASETAGMIVSHLYENPLAVLDFSREDREQFAQLIGYSHSGAADLDYMSDEALDVAYAMMTSAKGELESCADYRQAKLDEVRRMMRPAIAELFDVGENFDE